jgi:hypothetical protein
MAVAGLLACSGYAMADAPKLSLDPTVLTADSAAPQGLLMQGLDKAGMGKTLADAKLNIYGWVESGYTYNHRTGSGQNPVFTGSNLYDLSGNAFIVPGPFNHEYHNHYMLNQAVIRFERQVDTKKFDVGGMIEVMYGSDAAAIHPYGGMGFNGSDLSDNGSPYDPDSGNNDEAIVNFNPTWQFDIPQAYVTINLPVGNGLQLMVGKFASILGYESFDAVNNPFYSHSYLFTQEPFTFTGVLASYQVNDQLGLKFGVTRGWDMCTEDDNGCAIDVIGQAAYKINNQMHLAFNYTVGPENPGDSGHYRVTLNPILYWQATDALKLGVETLYVYDGGMNAVVNGNGTHAYGDVWGAAVYASYKINDMFTANLRLEKAHGYNDRFVVSGVDDMIGTDNFPSLNAYEVTLGATITPMPKDQCLKGLSIRPEIRYDFTDTTANKFYPANGQLWKDQLTFGCDVIFAF